MTDEHGSDSPASHEEIPQDHQSAEANVWSDDHPPVDDFADASTAGEEASVSQEAAGDGEENAAQTAAPSRSMLPLFAGIGGILLIGAVIYWQFGHSAPPPMMTAQIASPKSASSLSSNNAPIAPVPKKVEESDITALYKEPSDSSAANTTVSPVTSMAAAPEIAAPPAPSMPANPPVAAAPPPATVTAPAATAPADARLDTMAARMEALEKSMQTATQQLGQLSNVVAATQAMPPPAANQVSPALEDRLNKIEQSLMQIEHNQAAKAPPVTMPAEASTEASQEASSEVVTKSVSHAKTAKHKRGAKKAKAPAVRHHKAPSAPMPIASSVSAPWVLRAATPTEAWVAADSKSAELRHVQVGENLSGIGQIRAIRQTPSGWEIEGESGTIR